VHLCLCAYPDGLQAAPASQVSGTQSQDLLAFAIGSAPAPAGGVSVMASAADASGFDFLNESAGASSAPIQRAPIASSPPSGDVDFFSYDNGGVEITDASAEETSAFDFVQSPPEPAAKAPIAVQPAPKKKVWIACSVRVFAVSCQHCVVSQSSDPRA